MRTPLRLAATLLKSRFAQSVRGSNKYSPMRRILIAVEAEETLVYLGDSPAASSTAEEPVSPILWLTGSADVLSNPDIGKFTRQLQEARRTIFLETDGTQLRRRIHEFRPSERLYLTIRLYGTAHTHDRRMQSEGAFASAMEGIRAAQLSGFLLCAHVVVEHHTQLHEINLLLQQLGAMNLDGMIITAEDKDSEALQEMAVAARSLIGDPWWTSFSRLVQQSFNAQQHVVVSAFAAASRAGGTSQKVIDSDVPHPRDTAVSSEEVAVP
jgi:hypothetical protein